MATSKQPLVSIVVPVYNAARFLPDTIQTVKEQTYKNWELIFIDDVSSDDSVALIKKAAKLDSRIKIKQLPKNSGAATARNTGIDLSTGDYLAFLDADDLWDKNKLKKQIDFMKKELSSFSYTGYEFADEDGRPNGKIVRVPARISYS